MMRRIACVGDALKDGGKIPPYVGRTCTFGNAGHQAALIGGQAYCEACKRTGIIAKAGGPRRMNFMGEVALDGDIVLCKCPTPQRIVATLAGNDRYDDGAESAAAVSLASGATAIAPEYSMQKLASVGSEADQGTDSERICPNMTNAEFRVHIIGLRDEALALVVNRLAELNRWSPADARWFLLWFGTTERAARVAIATGLARMRNILAALTPANFIRYSAEAMRAIGCVSREISPGAVAEVCAPDTATHTIAIRLDFCTLRARHPRFDSQLLTLVHEISHFSDVFGSRDHWYSTHNAKDRADAKDTRTTENADNIAGYVVCSE